LADDGYKVSTCVWNGIHRLELLFFGCISTIEARIGRQQRRRESNRAKNANPGAALSDTSRKPSFVGAKTATEPGYKRCTGRGGARKLDESS
jgi:hypothetical protein